MVVLLLPALLAKVQDIRGHGEFSYRELLQILRAVPVHMPHGCHPGTFTRPAVLGASPASKRRQWAPRSSVAGRVSEDGEGAAASLLMPAGEEGPLALCASLTAAIQVRSRSGALSPRQWRRRAGRQAGMT